jgi:predicted transcriptional regulator
MTMVTTIRISKDLKKELAKRKLDEHDTYEDVIRDLLENTMELNEETKREIEHARAEYKKGKFYTLEQVKQQLGMD